MNKRDYKMAKTLVNQQAEMKRRNRKRIRGQQTGTMIQDDAKKQPKRHYS